MEQGVPHAMLPSEHEITLLSSQSISQPCVPGAPSGQVSVQREPASQTTPQLWSRQVKAHSLPEAQVQLPFAHSPAQLGLLPSQLT